MKPGKIVSLDTYRTERYGRKNELQVSTGGFCLPAEDRLWELLDRNISIAVWKELNETIISSLFCINSNSTRITT